MATDRLSAFDVVMPQPIPLKGKVLTQISNYWFSLMTDIIPNHLVATSVDDFPEECEPYRDALRGRSILARKTTPLPIECVARGYVSGSGWNEYLDNGRICGIALPPGMKESEKLPKPIFTPATKAEAGHDENISFETAAGIVGKETADAARATTLKIYERAYEIALDKGIIIADTKMEFGTVKEAGPIDECHARFSRWPKGCHVPGAPRKLRQAVREGLPALDSPTRASRPGTTRRYHRKTTDLYRQALQP